jgi:hypothetical protein
MQLLVVRHEWVSELVQGPMSCLAKRFPRRAIRRETEVVEFAPDQL